MKRLVNFLFVLSALLPAVAFSQTDVRSLSDVASPALSNVLYIEVPGAGTVEGTDFGKIDITGFLALSPDIASDATLETDSVSANELNATGVESELEAVIDLADLQGDLAATRITFSDPDSNYTATEVDAAIAELFNVINSGNPNASTGKVDWSQLVNVPAGFADGTDDGGGSIGADSVGTSELDDSANTPTAGDFVVVATGAADFEYTAPSEVNVEDLGNNCSTAGEGFVSDGAGGTDCTPLASTLEKSFSFYHSSDLTTYDGIPKWKFANAVTITEISCTTDAGTATLNIEERGETTPNTAGTDVLTSDIVCDSDQQESTTFSNAAIAADVWNAITISASATATDVNITIYYTLQ